MNGPYRLSADTIKRVVTQKSPGGYILSRSSLDDAQRFAHYVGRSDVDVGQRLQDWVGVRNYRIFWFDYRSSAKGAFELECVLWHHYREGLDNKDVHPRVPDGQSWACPVQGCPYSRAARGIYPR